MRNLICVLLLAAACDSEDKAAVERTTDRTVETMREGALHAKEKTKELADDVRNRAEPTLRELEAKLEHHTREFRNAPDEKTRQVARDAMDHLRREKEALEARMRE